MSRTPDDIRDRSLSPRALSRRAVFSRAALPVIPAALAPFVPLSVRRVFAATPPAGARRPENLVLLYHPNGLEIGWQPRAADAAFGAGTMLAPLEPVRRKLLVVGGVRGGIQNEVQAHPQGMAALWTGAKIPMDNAFSDHRSIDQIAAERLGAGAPLRSLELGVQTQAGGSISPSSVMVYTGPKQPAQPEDDPNRAFDRLFAGAGDPVKLARIRKEKGTVLDFMKAEVGDLRRAFGTEQKRTLDAHEQILRELEQRLARLGSSQCGQGFPRHKLTAAGAARDSRNFPEIARLQGDLMVLALECGVTRVVSLQLAHSSTGLTIPGVNDSIGLHGVMHTRPRTEKLAINKWFVTYGAELLQKLEAKRQPDGTTLLDRTLFVWGTEMAVGNHLNDPIPFFVAGGGADGPFKLGHYANLSASKPRHTRLLVSVLHALGVETVRELGDFREEGDRGPLEELRA